MSKSSVAFRMSLDALLDGASRARLWTFTFPGGSPILPLQAGKMWGNLQRRLVREAGFFGVRAFELHPGGHGLHVHAIASRYFKVSRVRKLANACGFGRVHVLCVPVEKASYVGKYISKQKRFPELKGMRLFARVGSKHFNGVPTNRIVSDSSQHRIFCQLFDNLTPNQRVRLYRYIPRLSTLASMMDCGICTCRPFLIASRFRSYCYFKVFDYYGNFREDWSFI